MGHEKFLVTRLILVFLFLLPCLMPHAPCLAADDEQNESHQLPRFVSIRAKEINLRTGPGERYPIDWVLRAKGWPLQITAEFDNWRRVKTWDGTSGWVHRAMLSKKRAVVVKKDEAILRRAPGDKAEACAKVAANTHGTMKKCEKSWCEIEFDGGKGWLPQAAIWGGE